MHLKTQRRVAARLLKCGTTRVTFAPARLKDIGEAITAADVRRLVREGVIFRTPIAGTSKARFRQSLVQRRKGRRQNLGSRKGKLGARMGKKRNWIRAIRTQRAYLQLLLHVGGITRPTFWKAYSLAGGGFFRSKKHIRLYLEEHGLIQDKDKGVHKT